MYRVVGEMQWVLPQSRNLHEFVEIHGSVVCQVKDGAIWIEYLEMLETRVKYVLDMNILETHVPHRISSGLMVIVESVMRVTYYCFSQVLLATMCQ